MNEAYDATNEHETVVSTSSKEKNPSAKRLGKEKTTPVNNGGLEGTATSVQIILGTYEKVLHGLTATVRKQSLDASHNQVTVEFADTFMLNAHRSAIRCLAVSPPSSLDTTKVTLASGSSDQMINLYHLSTAPPSSQQTKGPAMPTMTGTTITENPMNRELGSLHHHSGGINALYFPVRSKLLSAAEDSTIAVTRTRDWTVLSTFKAPIPTAHGRPSGDTAPLGGTPTGVNDFAIHPSIKLMVSVGKGERCMRLWNLVTGKKAAVLNYDKDLLKSIGEGRWSSGEGRRVQWNGPGEEFVVAFERGCVVYGTDSKPRCRILLPNTKLHQIHYIDSAGKDSRVANLLAISTEDGRILFYSTSRCLAGRTEEGLQLSDTPICEEVGHLGGVTQGLTGRIKDFSILQSSEENTYFVVTGSSDGAVRFWTLDIDDLMVPSSVQIVNGGSSISKKIGRASKDDDPSQVSGNQVGNLLGTYEAGNRITCLTAFVMSRRSQEDDNHHNGSKNSVESGTFKSSEEESASS